MKKDLQEKGIGGDKVGVSQVKKVSDSGVLSKVWRVKRWASEADKIAGKIYSDIEALKLFGAPQFTEFKKNVLLNEGINELWTVLCSAGGVRYDNANAQLGVGDSSVAEAATQTDLQAATNVLWKGMMTGFPTFGTLQRATWRSEFIGTEANFAWNEFSVRNGLAANRNLNRRVSAQGTKIAGQVWELDLQITLS